MSMRAGEDEDAVLALAAVGPRGRGGDGEGDGDERRDEANDAAHDGVDRICEGRHERHVIEAARFTAKIASKAARAGVAA